MNWNQILIRLGIDATAVKGGLGNVSALVKGWGANLASGLKGMLGKMFVGLLAIDKIKEIADKISEIKKISQSTGASSNFIQGAMLKTSAEEMTMPLEKFAQLLGHAKEGMPDALVALEDLGVTSKKNTAATLTYQQAIHNLSVQYDKLKDPQQKAALLAEAFGRSGYKLAALFNQGTSAIDKLSQDNFFTKISADAIDNFTTIKNDLKIVNATVTSTFTNLINLPIKGYKQIAAVVGALVSGNTNATRIKQVMDQMDIAQKQKVFNEGLANAAAEEGLSVQEKRAEILGQENELLEKQAELTATIADRDKLSVREMAERARQLMHQQSPLQRSHTVTQRMRTALQIDTLEERAKLAWEKGDDAGSKNLQGQADQIRKSNPWLKRTDVNPMSKTETELEQVNRQLIPVRRMAELVNKSHG